MTKNLKYLLFVILWRYHYKICFTGTAYQKNKIHTKKLVPSFEPVILNISILLKYAKKCTYLSEHECNLHIRYILEDECLIEFWITIFPVHLRLVFRLLVWQKIQLDKWICGSCRPICGWQLCALNNLWK